MTLSAIAESVGCNSNQLSTPRRQTVLKTALLGWICLWFAGCQPSTDFAAPDTTPQQPVVAVTSYPLMEFAQQIAGVTADVKFFIEGPQHSPEWKPTSSVIQTMQQADHILINGGDYEPWLQRVTLPRSRLTDTARGYYDQFVRIPDAVIHQHGPDGGHSHPGVVWATWLDPELAMSQAEQTRDVLLTLLPGATAEIRRSADALMSELRQLNDRVGELADKSPDTPLRVVGDAPVYQYLARRLNWDLKYVHWPRSEPLTEADQLAMEQLIKEFKPSLVLIRSTQQSDYSDVVANDGPQTVLIDMCEEPAKNQTLMQRLQQNLDRIETAITSNTTAD